MTASVVTIAMMQVAEHAVMRISWCMDSGLSVSTGVFPDVVSKMSSVAEVLSLVAAAITRRVGYMRQLQLTAVELL